MQGLKLKEIQPDTTFRWELFSGLEEKNSTHEGTERHVSKNQTVPKIVPSFF